MYDAHKNYAHSTIATAPSSATAGTSLSVQSGHGTRFPAPPFNVVVGPATGANHDNVEILRVTAVSGDDFTVLRTQEDLSTPRAIVVGDVIFNAMTAKAFTDLEFETISQAEAEAGTGTTPRIWTAERVAQAIAALAPAGGGDVTAAGSNDFTGTNTFAGAIFPLFTAMPALEVDVTKAGNAYSATSDQTFTYSDATPAAGTSTVIRITADSYLRTITIPSTYSLARSGAITELPVPAHSTLQVRIQYLSSRWEIIGDPVATTGSGSFVLSDSPELTTPDLGTPSAGNLENCTADGTNPVGTVDVPQIILTAPYTCALSDRGKHIYHPSSDTSDQTITIPDDVSVPFPVGTAITIINDVSAGDVIVETDGDTLVKLPSGVSGSLTLPAGTTATLIKVAPGRWIVMGASS